MPFSVVKWRWKPDVGAEEYPCGPSLTCNHSPTKSGTMFVDLLVNGVADTKSQHIDVYPCLMNDSLLDRPDVRSKLREAMDSAMHDGVERGGALLCDANGVCTAVTYPIGPRDDVCTFWFPDHLGGETRNPILIWHMHPYSFNDWVPCPRGGFRYSLGFSEPDRRGSGGRRHVMVDGNYAWFLPGTTNGLPAPRSSITKKKRFGSGACDILAAPII